MSALLTPRQLLLFALVVLLAVPLALRHWPDREPKIHSSTLAQPSVQRETPPFNGRTTFVGAVVGESRLVAGADVVLSDALGRSVARTKATRGRFTLQAKLEPGAAYTLQASNGPAVTQVNKLTLERPPKRLVVLLVFG